MNKLINSTGDMLEAFGALITFVLLIANFLTKIQKDKTNLYLRLLMGNNVLLLLSDICIGMLSNNSETVLLFKIIWILNYIFFVLDFGIFHFYLTSYIFTKTDAPKWIRFVVLPFVLAGTIMWIVSMFSHNIYIIDNNGAYEYCKDYSIICVLNIVCLAIDGIIIIIYSIKLKNKSMYVWLTYILFPLIVLPIDYKYDSVPEYLAITVSILIIYTIVNVQIYNKYNEQKFELYESRNKLLVSQIQPHFVFNSLTSIAQLCSKDPVKAKSTTIAFSEYLRINMESLNTIQCVPFNQEFDHLKTYLEIEKIRYADDLHIVYDLQTTDFQVPSLSIQPIIENAIKHGIGQKEDGGTVKISTKQVDKNIVIVISDDGVGYDVTSFSNDNNNHIGIYNVKNRLAIMSNGTLTTESEIGVGTTVTITIPKENINEYYSCR